MMGFRTRPKSAKKTAIHRSKDGNFTMIRARSAVEIATVTSKGQVTVPVAIRKALGLGDGTKLTFVLRQDGVVEVQNAEREEPADPAITAFLTLLEQSIASGDAALSELPMPLRDAMQRHAKEPVDLDEVIVGDVAL